MKNSSHRIAFYPCCANDIAEPRRILRGIADEIVYCDLRKPRSLVTRSDHDTLPIVTFLQADARLAINNLPSLHILFYRRDSGGEGGSGVFILGKRMLACIIQRFPDRGGLIITDGSNSGSRLFERMIRPEGYTSKTLGSHFEPAREQTFIQPYGLYTIKVEKLTQQSPPPYSSPAAGSESGEA